MTRLLKTKLTSNKNTALDITVKSLKMDKVYILTTEDKFIIGVFATKEAAFNAIKADSVTQAPRGYDGEEEFTPTAETVILGCDIYAHYNESFLKIIGLTTPAEDRVYQINEHEVR